MATEQGASDPNRAGSANLNRRLRDLYVDEGFSTYAIGIALGMDRQRVARLLRRDGIALSPRGAGRPRGLGRALFPATAREIVRDLYVRDRRTTAEIGTVFQTSGTTVRRLLREQGIRVRTTGGANREDRTAPGIDLVEKLYLQGGLSAAEVGKSVGCSSRIVLRLIHDMGWPVRVGGRPLRHGPEDLELICALYNDKLVAAALLRHGIPRVAPGGPIWQRFPSPVSITAAMVQELYVTCGLSTRQIELLTGQPSDTVGLRLRDIGVWLRPKGGRSPFLKRWRAEVAGEEQPSAKVRPRRDAPSARRRRVT